ncbi:Hypothetical predicted protein [Mytilus galloprovincialis]|uniref:C-type lectin domain-containing protein n=1 Tax=Mytilus galloprovincialis TaxID=29158 RepID=A0A8B6H0M7_MYTGA|nr:Hypothetical predicted protein [Mytilus galloprovincialis]
MLLRVIALISTVLVLGSATYYKPPRRCPSGWYLHGNSCYFFCRTQVNQKAASDICEKKGGYLARIDNIAEDNFLKQQAKSLSIAGKGSYWISPVCKKRVYQYKCSWKHESNNKAVIYEGWNSLEPNSNQKCAVLYCGYSYSWNDFNCNDKAYYICEKKVPSRVIPLPIPRPLPRPYQKPVLKLRPKSSPDSDSSDSSEKKRSKKNKKYGKKSSSSSSSDEKKKLKTYRKKSDSTGNYKVGKIITRYNKKSGSSNSSEKSGGGKSKRRYNKKSSSSSSSEEKKKLKTYRKKSGSGGNYNDGKTITRYNKKSGGSNSNEKSSGGKSKRRYNKKSSSSSSGSDEKGGKRSYSKKIPSPPKPLSLPPKRY